MRKDKIGLRPLNQSPQLRSKSSGNLLAKRLYRNNSLTKLAPLNNTPSILGGSLNTSLIPSISLRKLTKFDHSQPSIEISHGRIQLKRHEELPFLTQQAAFLKKKGAHRKFQKLDSITEKNIVPEQLKAEYSTLDVSQQSTKKWKPSRKWLSKLKQGKQSNDDKLTPQDFIQLIEQEGVTGNQFCYLEKGSHPYDLKIVEFGGAVGDEYITISARGVTYFNWQGSRFVTLQEWRRQAYLFSKIMSLQFFGKYKLHKNFSNWKKYYRKIAMKKTTDKLKAELLVHDRHLRQALLQTRGLCCRLQTQINYCYFDDSIPPLPYNKFKTAQQNFLNERFQKRISQVQQDIKCQVATCLGVSMRQFKQENKISSNKEGKGLPLLIGDQKNLEMPYTKEATLRVQQQKFKRFLKLVELLVVHSKINMMDFATSSTSRKLQQQNDSYQQYLKAKQQKKGKADPHFKGKQFIECQLQIEQNEQKIYLRPSRDDLTSLIEDIVNRSIIKLVRNHHRIINDPDINAILYEGAEQSAKQPDSTNILKSILGAEQKQESMVQLLNKSINRSYNFLQKFVCTLSPLVVQLFRNQHQLTKINQLTSRDFFSIKEWIEVWRKQMQQTSKLNQQHEGAVFLLNFRNVKEITIQYSNTCLSKIKEMVPKILENAIRKEEIQLSQALKLMEIAPIGIEVYISFQNNKQAITSKFDQYDDTLGEIGQLIEIIKDLGGSGENIVVRCQKQRKQLGQILKTLKAKIQQSEMHNKVHETYAQEQVKKMIPKVLANLESLYAKTQQPRLEALQMATKIKQLEQEYSAINQQIKKLRQYQKFLGMAEMAQETINKFAVYFNFFKDIWTYKLEVQQYHQTFLTSMWKSLPLEETKLTLDRLLEKAQLIKKQLSKDNSEQCYQIEYIDENMISIAVSDIKKKIKPILEAIECLRDPSLQERELKTIKNQFQNKNKRKLSELISQNQVTVSLLLKDGIVQQLDFLKKIVFKSKKQLELNTKMAAVNRFWGDSAVHSSKGLIDNFAQHYWTIAAQIDQKITVINCVREDPEVEEGQFRLRVQNEKNLFDSLRLMLCEWEKHHNFLNYFEPIFANPYWKGTSEYKAYTYAETNWKKLTKQISKDFSLRKLASQQKKHFSILKQNNTIFQDLKHAVELFLNAKRQAFPKLYFLSNEQLLHLLLQDKDYTSIDKHLPRIFPNLKSLELNQQRNCPLAVKNLVNESLTLRTSPAKPVLQLEEGLKIIEERIKESLKSAMLKCSNYYLQDDFSRKTWINQNILQILLFIGNSEFTKLLQYDYLQCDGQDLKQLLSYQISQIKELYNLIRQDLSSRTARNYKYEVLLMQAGHFRDIITKLIQQNVRDDKSYQWQRQIRSYYNGNEIAETKYLTQSVDYGYEFVCPNYSYTICTLSEKYFVELVNTIGNQYVPILVTSNDLITNFCISNAKNYFCINLQPKLLNSYLHNICQGALASNTFLQMKNAQLINAQTASLISSFIYQAKCIIDRRQLFYFSAGNKSSNSPSFNIALRMSNPELKPIKQHLKINYRVINVPQIPIPLYVSCICSLTFPDEQSDLAHQLEKACQIINKCCGYEVLGFEQIRNSLLRSISPQFSELRSNMFKQLMGELNNQIIHAEELRFFEKILKELILLQKFQETFKQKNKPEKDPKTLMNLVDILAKKQHCILVGPSYNGKKHFMFESYRASGVGPVETYNTDFITYQQFLGTFQNQLWKEGILPKHLKQLSYFQEEWLVFESSFGPIIEQLLKSIVQGYLLLENGEVLYLSSSWKFIISTDIIINEKSIPKSCEIIYSERYSTSQEQLQHELQTVIRKYFKSNIEGFSILKNICLNNFQKILKFRLKGRFLKPQQLIKNFINIFQSVISKCPEKMIEAKDNQSGIQKMFLWCMYWTFYSTLSTESAKKFEAQFSEQIKIQSDRTISLSISKFEFDNPSGTLKRIEAPTVVLDDNPYVVTSERQAIFHFIQLYLQKNRNILLIGDGVCGKSQFLSYIKQNLGQEKHSFLTIKLNKQMTFQKFEQLLYRKAKVIVSQNKQKFLAAINGKQLIIQFDDINLLDQSSSVGRFIRCIAAEGYYYDHITLQKIYLSNISIIAAENSSFEFNLSYDFLKNFKPINLPQLTIREIAKCYEYKLKQEYAHQICHNVASLHQFSIIGEPLSSPLYPNSIDLPLRVLKSLINYEDKENIVRMWEYLSLKEYICSFPQNQSHNSKISAEIKNYSNLMLKNNQQPISPVSNIQTVLSNILHTYPYLQNDPCFQDYYAYLIMKIKLKKPINLFTINESICPSFKEQILLTLCNTYQLQFIHPFRLHQISSKLSSSTKIVVYITNLDENFEDMIEHLISETKGNLIYIIDFYSTKQWERYNNRYPSLPHYGSRYYKKNDSLSNHRMASGLIDEIEQWSKQLSEARAITNNQIQQISKLVDKHHQKIINECTVQINKLKQLLSRSEQIQKNGQQMKKQLQFQKSQLDKLSKEEEQQRKQLLSLKNNYQYQENEQQKNNKNSKIQTIQTKLNEIMVLKRSGQDQLRVKQDECENQIKILNTMNTVFISVEPQLHTYQLISQNSKKISAFLAIIEYYYLKQDQIVSKKIQELSLTLPIAFQQFTRRIYKTQINIREHTSIIWLLNNKSIIIQDETQKFIQSVSKVQEKCQIINSLKELQEIIKFEPDTAYFIVGQLRSEAAFLNDMSNITDRDYKERNRTKEELKENKDQRYIKQQKQDKPDYKRNIYFIFKEKEKENYNKQEEKATNPAIKQKQNKENKEESLLTPTYRMERQNSRLLTMKSTTQAIATSAFSIKRQQNIQPKEKQVKKNENLKQQVSISIKYKQIKQGQPYSKTDHTLQNFIVVTLQNKEFHLGGKKIVSVFDKNNNLVSNVTLICNKPITKSHREEIKNHNQHYEDHTKNFVEELLDEVEPFLSGTLKNQKQELNKLKQKKQAHYKIILDKILQNTPKSLNDISRKEGDFIFNLSENIRLFQEKVASTEKQRTQPYAQYFQLAFLLWKYFIKISSFYPQLKICKKQFKHIIFKNIYYNSSTDKDENSNQIQPKVNIQKSKNQLTNEIIEYIIGTFNYQKSLLSLCYLSILLQDWKKNLPTELIHGFELKMKDETLPQNIVKTLKKQTTLSCMLYLSIKSPGQFLQSCHQYINCNLQLNFEQDYYKIKSKWVNIQQNLVVIALPGANPFQDLYQDKKCLFVSENSEYSKCVEYIIDKSLSKIVLINFAKKQSYSKLLAILQQNAQNTSQLKIILLYTSTQHIQSCQFKQKINTHRVIQLQKQNRPNLQLANAIQTISLEAPSQQLQKMLKLVLLNDIQLYFKQRLQLQHQKIAVQNACFYDSDFLQSLVSLLQIKETKQLFNIIIQTIYQGKEKYFLKLCKKYLKKEDGDYLLKVYFGDVSNYTEQTSPQLSYFMSLEPTDILAKLSSIQGCQQLARGILPPQFKKKLKKNMFYAYFEQHKQNNLQNNTYETVKWEQLQNMSFQSYKNLQSVKLIRQNDLLKNYVRKQNIRNYLLYRWIQHKLKALKQTNKHCFISDQSKDTILRLKKEVPLWGFPVKIATVMHQLEKRIYHLEQIINSSSPQKKFNVDCWNNASAPIYLYLYSCPKKGDLNQMQVHWRLFSEKDDKQEKGWLIQSIQLKNCKFDPSKSILEINDRNDNKKISNIVAILSQRQPLQGLNYSLPLVWKQKQQFKIDLPCKFKDDGCPWKDKIVGVIKGLQP